jgi:hypothetical protein
MDITEPKLNLGLVIKGSAEDVTRLLTLINEHLNGCTIIRNTITSEKIWLNVENDNKEATP